MRIQDTIYGKLEITQPVIIDLINSKPFQRLKYINQYGATVYLQQHRTTTRYEHSVGAWYLSKKYKRSIGEQIASLLHDIPHTAFSHVADFVMKDKDHEYHDKFLEKVISQSEIPEVLEKHHINLSDVLEKERYPLLDNKLPDISVDRWDYFLRDGFIFGIIPKQTITLFQTSLKEKDNVFYFTDLSVAALASILFLNCSRLIWLDPTSHGSFFLLSGAITIAMKKNLFSEDDLFGTDDEVLKKLESFDNNKINVLLTRLHSGKQFHYAPKESAEFYGPNKPRYIDPLVETKNGLERVSNLIPGMTEYFEKFMGDYKYLGVIQEQ